MRVFLIILRVGVLLLGFAGIGGAGVITYLTWDDFISKKEIHKRHVNELKAAQVLMPKMSAIDPHIKSTFKRAEEQAQKEVANEYPRYRMFPFLLAGIVLALLGSFLALLGRTTSGGVLLLLAALGPAVLFLPNLILTFPYILAGLLSLSVSFLAWVTRPKAAPVGEGRDEDEEPSGPRRAAKRKNAPDEEEEPVDAIRKPKRKGEADEEDEPADAIRTPPKRKSRLDVDEEPAEDARPDKKRKPKFEDEDEEPAPRSSSKRKRD